MALGLYVNRMDGGPQSPSFVCDDCDKYSRISSSSVEGGGRENDLLSFIVSSYTTILSNHVLSISLFLSRCWSTKEKGRETETFLNIFSSLFVIKVVGRFFRCQWGKCRALLYVTVNQKLRKIFFSFFFFVSFTEFAVFCRYSVEYRMCIRGSIIDLPPLSFFWLTLFFPSH